MNLLHRLSTCLTLSLVCLPLSAQQAANTTCATLNCASSPADTEPQHTDGERAVAIVNQFLGRHKNFITCPQNATAMTSYLEAHNLSPLRESSFEKAFEDLKRQGQLRMAPR